MLSFLKKYFSYSKTNKTLWILILLDIFFIAAYAIFLYLIFIRVQFDWLIADKFHVDLDGGYPEIFQYLKYLIIVFIIIYIMFKKKATSYLSWFFVFVLLLLDDMLQFHEMFGKWISEKLNYSPMFGFGIQDLGELTYITVFGSIVLIFLFIEYRSGSKKYKKRCIDLGLLFALFLFFGIAIDMLNQFVSYNRYIDLFMTLLEDGGEMITLSFIVWYFLFIAIKPKNNIQYLHQYF